MANVLILEPNRPVLRRMADILSRGGHRITQAQTVPEAERALSESRKMTVLDAQVPFTQSCQFLRMLAERGLPVLFVTADSANAGHLRAMYRGDCDVLLMPFTDEELAGAVTRLLENRVGTLSFGGLRLDMISHRVTKDGEPLTLTAQEFELLQALMRSPDEPVSRQELLRTAWGYQSMGITRTVDVHVQRLRRKLGPKAIETVYKTGYRLSLA